MQPMWLQQALRQAGPCRSAERHFQWRQWECALDRSGRHVAAFSRRL